MIIENTQIHGIETDLAYLDGTSSKLGFVRWQWEYTRATYDYKIQEHSDEDVYYLRINTRAVKGKLESPDAILRIEAVYMGKATFPHGLDYECPIPEAVRQIADDKIMGMYQVLKNEQIIEQVMLKEVPSIALQASLFEAAQVMKHSQAGVLAVVKDEQLVGVVTERDLAIRGYAEKQADSMPVENLMSTSVYKVDAGSSVSEAIRLMTQQKISGLPVVKNGSLVGMVTLNQLAAKDFFG
ncbi:YugN family protein [Paenibacillus thalictri]|uniref:CBS domain-containing protein n=1 Tax=Paenibacillus thalictri TaxID=2527873 RepID=A0A4Q9DIB6_9BACL|nr:CBS domain-containing protein [Paenibacillus thalictri]